MSVENTAIVLTTIQPPTPSMRRLAERARTLGLNWLVIGDRKGPADYAIAPADFFSIERQRALPFKLAKLLPEKHYARKNLGYLLAMSRGCTRLYETDDDNAPLDIWDVREQVVAARRLQPLRPSSWANVYGAFTDQQIWPRGFPLSHVRGNFAHDFVLGEDVVRAPAPIQQGLANGSPDVDAIWRLVLDREVTFATAPNVLLPQGVWCPFNSQNTWWWKEAFPLLYLPSHCSFRMTDIWRSFVAQRCLWELGHELEFHAADVHQDRNEHNLMHDFAAETAGYLRNEDIRLMLESCSLLAGPAHAKENVFRCYETLVREKVVAPAELDLVQAWLDDCA